MADLKALNLRKSYGQTLAIADFTIEVAEGEFLALLGPSGCGKTTVMRIIAGITDCDSGEVTLGGQRINHLPPEARNIGLVFQSYALFPHMTVARNVAFGLQMRRLPSAEIGRRVDQALALVDLSSLSNRFPRQLSGGQQQRVALARSIVIEPAILLLDEPLSNLDAKLREHLRDDLKALQRRLGVTTIYVTHDQSEAMALADRVVLMNRGSIVEVGDPRSLYHNPRCRFTAEFLGLTNLVPGRANNGQIETPWGQRLGPSRGSDVLLSVRPEDLAIAPAADGPGEVVDITFLGADIEHKIVAEGMTLRARSSGRGAVEFPIGTRVTLTIPSDSHRLIESA